jgi:hypothetical protein
VSVSNEQRRKANTLSTPVVGKRTQVPTKRNRVSVDATVKLRAYPVIQEMLEGELKAGIRKVFKYAPTSSVDEDYLIDHADVILNYLENGICELIDFGDD